jgi:hypothetical protein
MGTELLPVLVWMKTAIGLNLDFDVSALSYAVRVTVGIADVKAIRTFSGDCLPTTGVPLVLLFSGLA